MMSESYILAVDLGTTSAKAVVAHVGGGILAQASRDYATIYQPAGIVEQDPNTVLDAAVEVLGKVVSRSRIVAEKVAGISFSGIWQSMLPVDQHRQPLCRAMLWADQRSLDQSLRLSAELNSNDIKSRTGCTIHPMYFLPRLLWFKEKAPEILRQTRAFISIKDYVLSRLFGELLTDKSIASGTGLWRISSMDWDEDLLRHIGLTKNILPRLVEPTTLFQKGLKAEFAVRMGLLPGTPGIIGAADGALAHLGAVGISEDRMSLTVGTGSALRLSKPEPFVRADTQAWCYYLAENNWLTGGVIQDAGNVLDWYVKNFMASSLDSPDAFALLNRYAAEIEPGAGGMIFLPFLSGERCPNNRPDARGTVYGLNFSHTKKHLARAVMEGIAYRISSVFQMLTGDRDPDLVVTGGLLKSPVWLKIISDYLGKKLWLPGESETTAWGAILIGLKALGAVDTLPALNQYVSIKTCQAPDAEANCEYRRIDRAYRELYQKIF
jgi:gluconokinase